MATFGTHPTQDYVSQEAVRHGEREPKEPGLPGRQLCGASRALGCAAVCRSRAGERSRTQCCGVNPTPRWAERGGRRPGPTMAANVSVSWSAGHTQASRSSGPSPRGRVAAPCRVVPPSTRPPPSRTRVRAFRQLCRLSCSALPDSLGPAVLGTGPLARGSGSGVLWCGAPPRSPSLRSRFPPGPSGLSRVRTWRAGRGRREVASPRGRWGSRSALLELSSDVLYGAGGELRAQRGM